ncbi:MAG: hypothetical protein ACK2TU_06400, partial [Anaerolineales bacterium]
TKTAIICNTGGTKKCLCGDLYAGYRVEKSYFGYDPSVLKSGIQKYARRAEVDKGLWCLVEMDLFSLLEWNGAALNEYLRQHPYETCANTKGQAQRLRTNLINRLVVMMSEEVSISAWWMPLKILELYQKWVNNRGNTTSRKYLVDMYLYLTSQEMIRIISDIHSVYQLLDYAKPKKMSDTELKQIRKRLEKKYPHIYKDQGKVGKVKWTISTGQYQSILQPCIDGIVYNLEIGSDNIFYWIKKLNDYAKQHGIPKYKCTRIVWELLYSFIDRNKEYAFVRVVICALEEFYKRMTHKEKPIYLYHAVLLIVRRKEIDWTSTPPAIDTNMTDINRLYSEHLKDGRMKIDDYIMDLHTRGGKKVDNCLENFALEGARVKNENKKFLNKDYREIYILSKQELDRYNSKVGKR